MSKRPQAAETAFLVRSHDPSEGALERMGDWFEALGGLPVARWVSIDESNAVGGEGDARARIIQMLEERGLGWRIDGADGSGEESAPSSAPGGVVHLHCYSQDEMREQYPVLGELERLPKWKQIQETYAKRGRKQSLAWGFHVEAINIWYQREMAERPYEHVWVLEDDLGILGSAQNLIRLYGGIEADLIADGIKPLEDGWHWEMMHSAGYGARLPVGERFFAKEHCQRWSRSLLTALHEASRDGVSGWSESAVPSLCHHEAGLRMVPFLPGHIGRPYDWNTKLRPEQWERLRQLKEKQTPLRLFHALKF